MSISFSCECGKRLKARAELAGKTGICPACNKKFKVPFENEPPTTPVRPPIQMPVKPKSVDDILAEKTEPRERLRLSRALVAAFRPVQWAIDHWKIEMAESKRRKAAELAESRRWRARCNRVSLYDDDTSTPYTVIGPIVGHARTEQGFLKPKKNGTRYETTQSAIMNLKENAARMGADAVIFVEDDTTTTTFSCEFRFLYEYAVDLHGTAVKFLLGEQP